MFDEYDTSSSVMIVLEGDDPLGADAHAFYDEMVRNSTPTPPTYSTSRTSGATR